MNTVPPLYQVRKYQGGPDFHLVNEWWSKRMDKDFPETLLPPDGFIVERDGEPVCAGWVYLSCGIGVAFVEWIVSRPGEPMPAMREAFGCLIDFMKAYLRESDYGCMWINTLKSISRVAEGMGFEVMEKERVAMLTSTNQDT
jgi:hypothetical protein